MRGPAPIIRPCRRFSHAINVNTTQYCGCPAPSQFGVACDAVDMDNVLHDWRGLQRRLRSGNLRPSRRVRHIQAVCELRVILSFVLQPEFHGDGARSMIRRISFATSRAA